MKSTTQRFTSFGISNEMIIAPTFQQGSEDSNQTITTARDSSSLGAVSCIAWFPSPHNISNSWAGNISTSSQLLTLLLVTVTTHCICIWAVIKSPHESQNCDSLRPLPITNISLNLLFDHIQNLDPEDMCSTDENIYQHFVIDNRVTCVCAISDLSMGSIVFGFSNGTLIRVDIELEDDCNWKIVWFRKIFDSSIDGIELTEDHSRKLFVWSGQVCTLIVLDRICTIPLILFEDSILSGVCLWKRSVMSYDVINSVTFVRIPQLLNCHPFPDCRVYALVVSLDGTIVCLPCHDDASESHQRLVLFSTPFQIFGLSVDPLGFSFSFLVNSNERTTKRYHQAIANHLHFRPLPWCPLSSMNNAKFLESMLWSIICDPSKSFCSLSSLYMLITQAVLEIEVNENDSSRREATHVDDDGILIGFSL